MVMIRKDVMTVVYFMIKLLFYSLLNPLYSIGPERGNKMDQEKAEGLCRRKSASIIAARPLCPLNL
jgi:hypothetical protein